MNQELANQIQAQVSALNKSLETARRNKVSVEFPFQIVGCFNPFIV